MTTANGLEPSPLRPAKLPLVAVVGRPNVGKSSLVNRIVGRRVAIVQEEPGVTRDRNFIPASWTGRDFALVDTGGWLAGGGELDKQVSHQAERALEDASVILFVVDTTVGVTEEDEAVANLLRQHRSSVLVVANKVDSATREADAWAFTRLGMGNPWMVSALHGRGSGDLLDEVVARIEANQGFSTPGDTPSDSIEGAGDAKAPKIPAVAIVGRPNVGKSTLFNRLVGEERSITHDLAGTTRDSIDTLIETPDGTVKLVDTAGMRRRAKSATGSEYYSLVRALQAIDASDVALLVIDGSEGVTHQDQRLAERIDAAGSPVVIVVNKWDLLDTDARTDLREDIADRLGFLSYAPLLPLSALTGKNVHKLLPALRQSFAAYGRRIPTGELNTVVQAAQRAHPAPNSKVMYATQGAIEPPTITLFATRELPAPWLRYLERKIREHFALGPTPLDLRVRRRDAAGGGAGRRSRPGSPRR